jgi:gas vesicle protein
LSRHHRDDGLAGSWLFWGVVFGLAFGALAAFLLLPDSGLSLRKRLEHALGRMRGQIDEGLRQAIPEDRLDSSLEAGRQAAKRVMQDSRGR